MPYEVALVDCLQCRDEWWRAALEGMFSRYLKRYQLRSAWLKPVYMLVTWPADWLIHLRIINWLG